MKCNPMFARLLFALLAFGSFLPQLARTEDLESRKQRIDQMSAIEKDELRGKQKRFESLSSEEQDKYRALHQDLEQRENGERLQAVMQSYYSWLKSLDAVQRSELQELSAEERIARIKKLMEQQEHERFRELSAVAAGKIKTEDFAIIKQWITAFVAKHQEEILKNASEFPENSSHLLERLGHLEPSKKANILWGRMLRNRHESTLLPKLEDEKELTERLQPETRDMLTKMDGEQKSKVMLGWIIAAVIASNREFVQNVSDEELEKFHETLPADVQSRLALLPPGEFEQRLKMEFMRTFMGGGGSRGPGGRRPWWGPGRPPGFIGPGGPGGGDGRGQRGGPGGDSNRPPRAGGERGGPGPDNRGPGSPKTTPPKQAEA